MVFDKSAEKSLSDPERLRLVIEDSMRFLGWLTFRAMEAREVVPKS